MNSRLEIIGRPEPTQCRWDAVEFHVDSRIPEQRCRSPRFGLLILCVSFFVSFCVLCGDLRADDLLPDPTFTNVSEFAAAPKTDGWTWHRIEEPCAVRINNNRAMLQGGKIFLHSAAFPVEASTIYELQLEVSGDAKFAVEILWWQKDGLPTSGHRSILVKPNRLTESTTRIQARIRSPSDVATAYVRLAAEAGHAVVGSPVMRAAAGQLLLKLDAAAPGPQPNQKWQDLTGRNQDFVLQSVKYSEQANSFVFEKPGAACIGNPHDAARFDFETDRAAGAGRGSLYTVVLYAKLSGRSGSGIVNKFGDPTQAGWSIGLEWDEFGLDRISTLQQSNNMQNRTIDGFPGRAGDGADVKLSATDGKFHLYVIHLTGSGHHDGSVYFDGSETPLRRSPWPFGLLNSGSIRNDAPLRLGALNKHGFRGEIGFVEIWSGSRLQDGMRPAEYSKYRHNQGAPLRAK